MTNYSSQRPLFSAWGDDICLHLLDGRLALAERDDRQEIELPPKLLARYVRVYQLSPTVTITVEQTPDGLAAQQAGLGSAPLFAESETEFFVKMLDIAVTFQRDAAGTVTGLVLHRAGEDILARKVK